MNKTRFFFFIVLVVLGLVPTKSYSQNFDYKENAVYVYNFVKYTNWASRKSSIQIGIIGNSPVEDALKNLVAQKRNGSPTLSVRNISVNESKNVDVLIVSKSETDQIKKIAAITANLPILVIAEKENMSRFGVCISFFIDEDNNYKTQYQLSLRNCKQRKLSVSEQIQNNAVLIR